MDKQLRNTILIVDDMVSNRIFLGNIFKGQYKVLEACNGETAMRLMRKHHASMAAVLLDIIMPVKDGFRTLEEMRKEGFLQDFPVLVITSDVSSKSEIRALELGASDLIKKPYDPYVIKRRVSSMMELFEGRRKLENRVNDLSRAVNAANTSIINTLAAVTEFRSLESGQHIHRIQGFTRIALEAVAEFCPNYHLKQESIELIVSASVMHDIGKISIPDAILNKPGRLTKEEFEIMKTHAVNGCQILKSIEDALDKEYMEYAYNICRYHHERWDGKGYPDGLKRDNVPLCAQVVALADVYDALTSPRVYKEAYSHKTAVRMILGGECGEFNPDLIKCFRLVEKRFERCAREYADAGDDAAQEGIHLPAPAPAASIAALSDVELTMAKYNSALQLVDGLVLEVDMDKGTYKRVHNSINAFEGLRGGSNVYEVFQELLNTSVHPEDKKIAAGHMLSFHEEFFKDGLRKQTTCYRMRSSPWSDYYWVQATNLRINTRNPNERKALCVWTRMFDSGRQGGALENTGAKLDAHFWDRFPFIMVRCKADRAMSIEWGTERLAGLLGCTREELDEICGGCLAELIVPEDRALILLRMQEGLAHEDSVTLTYRLRRKEGTTVWVQDCSRLVTESDGEEYVYHVLTDRTKERQETDRLKFTLERYQMLMSGTDEIYFEFGLQDNQGILAENFYRAFGYEASEDALHFSFSDAVDAVHPEDTEKLYEIFREIEQGMNIVTSELRLRRADGEYMWCRLRIIGQQRDDGRTFMLAGTIANHHQERMTVEALRTQVAYDGLTKLLNRTAAAAQVEQYLQCREPEQSAALLILDIDEFSAINSAYGHLAGDTILLACADMMNSLFQSTDIMARLGGDEFLLLLRDIDNREAVTSCCREIQTYFAKEVAGRLPGKELTCSVGVALVPEDGTTFQALFQKADTALRYAKDQGKNRAAFYSDVGDAVINYSSERTSIDSERYSALGDLSMVEYALHQLQRSSDTEGTIQTLLEITGRQLDVSRVCIFENSRDNRYCSNTFEWCNEGISAEIDNLQNLSYEAEMAGWADLFDEEGIFYCRDVREMEDPRHRALLEPQGIRSMLQCAIWDGGVFRGFVGFDECVKERIWTREELQMLNTVSESISLFLLKKRTQDDMAAWSDSLLHVLNHATDLIYVVDANSHELLFVNEQLQRRAPLRLGDHCYHAIMNRDTPCENCPIGNRDGAEIMNGHLNCRIQARASGMVWDGQDAELIICTEVQKAMEPLVGGKTKDKEAGHGEK